MVTPSTAVSTGPPTFATLLSNQRELGVSELCKVRSAGVAATQLCAAALLGLVGAGGPPSHIPTHEADFHPS